jgi:G protein-coupled receptor GPR1
MYLQIFQPTRLTMLGHDGLYRVRHWVVGAWLLLPNLSAALAFINPGPAYLAQGGFCTLPLRPFWYRLALFWIPRYMIWVYIVFVAIAITRYVGSEFKVFGQERDNSTSQIMTTQSTPDTTTKDSTAFGARRQSMPLLPPIEDEVEDCAPDDIESIRKPAPKRVSPPESAKSLPPSARRQSLPSWAADLSGSDASLNPFATQSKSTPGSRRGSRQAANGVLFEDFGMPPGFDSGHRPSVTSLNSMRSSGGVSFDGGEGLAPITENAQAGQPSSPPKQSANRALKQRRRAIQRQLRLLFIYPCIYMLLWIIPFVINCMNYFDYWAQHPIWPLKVLQIFCLTIMTAVDVLVFCWRERPWRHIPGSDGTFSGSFLWWRFCFDGTWTEGRRASRAPSALPDVQEKVGSLAKSGWILSSFKGLFGRKRSIGEGDVPVETSGHVRARPPHKRTFSGGSDRRHMEAERAHERLALERADYEQNRKSLQERRASVISQQQAAPARKEWFDQGTQNDVDVKEKD